MGVSTNNRSAMSASGKAPMPEVRSGALTDDSDSGNGEQLVEVWGDTVDLRHLSISLMIGVPVSAGSFLLASRVLGTWVADVQVARTYALLFGLLGCIASGVLCAWLFKPKRHVVEETLDTEGRREAIAQLQAEPHGLGRMESLPADVVSEMKELGLYDAFLEAERDAAGKETA